MSEIHRTRGSEPLHPRTKWDAKSRTRQSEAEATDINRIIKQYHRTGVITHYTHRVPMYGDFSLSRDLQASLNLVAEVNDSFMQLPAEVRSAAENSPVRFLEMLGSKEGSDHLVAAGLQLEVRPGDEGFEEFDAAPAASQEDAPAEPTPSGEAAPEP